MPLDSAFPFRYCCRMGWDTESSSWVVWPDPDDGPLYVEVRWRMLGGRWECVGLSIEFAPGVPERPLTTTDVRSLAMTELLRRAAEELQTDLFCTYRYPDHLTKDGGRFGRFVDGLIDAADTPRKPGRPPLPLEKLEKVARVYREAFAERKPPTIAVAKKFVIGHSTAATWVSKCRAAGLLGPTTKGQAGGIEPPEPKEDE